MMLNQAIIGVGSNINPHKNIQKAQAMIKTDHHFIAASTLVETRPIGYLKQPNFINGALLVETPLDRNEFIGYLHQIEKALKRVRTSNKFGPRTIDLDLVVWNGKITDTDVYSRDFLRNAIIELCPDFLFPAL